jgi:hypothetical protein
LDAARTTGAGRLDGSLVDRHAHVSSPLRASPAGDLANRTVIVGGTFDRIVPLSDLVALRAVWLGSELITARQGHFGYAMVPLASPGYLSAACSQNTTLSTNKRGVRVLPRNNETKVQLMPWFSSNKLVATNQMHSIGHLMKNDSAIVLLIGLACASLSLTGCQPNQTGSSTAAASPSSQAKTGGHLIVQRTANFGERIGLILKVDGKEVALLSENRTYDGYLSPGQHILSAQIDPNPEGYQPWRKTLTIENGQTYSFSAGFSGERLTLVRN